jgi:hypothetical protein
MIEIYSLLNKEHIVSPSTFIRQAVISHPLAKKFKAQCSTSHIICIECACGEML